MAVKYTNLPYTGRHELQSTTQKRNRFLREFRAMVTGFASDYVTVGFNDISLGFFTFAINVDLVNRISIRRISVCGDVAQFLNLALVGTGVGALTTNFT